MCVSAGGSTCEDVAVPGPDEAPLHKGAHRDVPARGAAEAWVAGALAPQLIQGEGIGAVPLHHSHHEVRVTPVLRWGRDTSEALRLCLVASAEQEPGQSLQSVPSSCFDLRAVALAPCTAPLAAQAQQRPGQEPGGCSESVSGSETCACPLSSLWGSTFQQLQLLKPEEFLSFLTLRWYFSHLLGEKWRHS